MSHVTVLVVTQRGADPLDQLIDSLRGFDGIELAANHIVDLAAAEQVIRDNSGIDAVLLMGRELDLDDVTERLRQLRSQLHIVAIAIETGRTHLSFSDPNFDDVGRILVSLGKAASGRSRTGQVLRYRAHIPDNDTEPWFAGLPAIWSAQVEPENVDVLVRGLDWVEKSAKQLLDAWFGGRDGHPGFGLTWDAIESWLASLGRLVEAPAVAARHDFEQLLSELDKKECADTPLAVMHARFGQNHLALKLFLIVVAGELDIRFQRLFGALHDDYGRRQPSLGLACAIIAATEHKATPLDIRSRLAVLPGLETMGLVGAALERQSAEHPLAITPQLIDWLLSGDADRLFGAQVNPLRRNVPSESLELVPATRVRRLRHMLRRAEHGNGEGPKRAILVEGEDTGWLPFDAASLDRSPLLIGPPTAGEPAVIGDASLGQLIVAANLGRRRLVVDLTQSGSAANALWSDIAGQLDKFDHTPLIVTGNAAQLLSATAPASFASVRLPAPTADERRQAIAAALAQYGQFDEDLAEAIVEHTPLPPGRIPTAVALAHAAAREAGRILELAPEDWRTGFRRAASAHLPSLARRIEPSTELPRGEKSQLDLVVLPDAQREQLEDLLRHVRFNRAILDQWGYSQLVDARGVSALFAGESGTGKTTAATAVASELGADLYVIDLAQVVSKYIGETEKNLNAAFAEAEEANAVLVFDEADALFGKRSAVSDAHDRYANIEVAYLLQRLQQFAGLALLTTNEAANLDPAFARRLRFHIEFPRPAAAERLKLWEQSLPQERRAVAMPLSRLAMALDVTGGTIRQMAMHAAVLAAEAKTAITLEHLLAGARSQLLRLGQYDDLAKLEALADEAGRKVA